MSSLKSDTIRKVFGAAVPNAEIERRPLPEETDDIIYSEVAIKGRFGERLKNLLEEEFRKWNMPPEVWHPAFEAEHQRWMEQASHWAYDPSLWVPENVEASVWDNYKESVEFGLLYWRDLPMEFIPREQDIQRAQREFEGWLSNNGWDTLIAVLDGKDPHAFASQVRRIGQDLLRERSLAEGPTTYKNFIDKYGTLGSGGGSIYPDLVKEAVRLSTSPEYQKHFSR